MSKEEAEKQFKELKNTYKKGVRLNSKETNDKNNYEVVDLKCCLMNDLNRTDIKNNWTVMCFYDLINPDKSIFSCLAPIDYVIKNFEISQNP